MSKPRIRRGQGLRRHKGNSHSIGNGNRMMRMRRSQFPSLLRNNPEVHAVARENGWNGDMNHDTMNWLYCIACCVLSSCCDDCSGTNCPPPCFEESRTY